MTRRLPRPHPATLRAGRGGHRLLGAPYLHPLCLHRLPEHPDDGESRLWGVPPCPALLCPLISDPAQRPTPVAWPVDLSQLRPLSGGSRRPKGWESLGPASLRPAEPRHPPCSVSPDSGAPGEGAAWAAWGGGVRGDPDAGRDLPGRDQLQWGPSLHHRRPEEHDRDLPEGILQSYPWGRAGGLQRAALGRAPGRVNRESLTPASR